MANFRLHSVWRRTVLCLFHISIIAGCGSTVTPASTSTPPEESKLAMMNWTTHTSLAGFYSVEHPADWRVFQEDNITNIFSSDELTAITISAFHGDAPIPNFPKKWIHDMFEKEEQTSEMEAVSRNGWNGFKQTFRDREVDRTWIAIVAQSGQVVVLITANSTAQEMIRQRATCERILNSIKLHVL